MAENTTTASAQPSPWRLGMQQCGLSMLLLLAMAGFFAAAYCGSGSRAAVALSAAEQDAYWQRQGGRYAYHPLSLDTGDYLIQRVMPGLDLSGGGVVMVGSSTMQHAVITWGLPAAEDRLVKNLSVESANLHEQFQWLDFLVRQHGLGASAAGRTLVIMGLYHGDARPKRPGSSDWNFVPRLFARYPEYHYDLQQGLSQADDSDAVSRIEHMRRLIRNGLLSLQDDGLEWLRLVLSRHPSPESPSKAQLHEQLKFGVGTLAWTEDEQTQTRYLAQSLDLLRGKQVDVVGVLLPMRDFNDDVPHALAFDKIARQLFADRGLRFVDLSHSQPDAVFADGSHLGYVGQHAASKDIMAIARQFLSRELPDAVQRSGLGGAR